MRRLPIFFLIDVSESMVGEPIEQVEHGLGTIVKTLKTDPYALETVHISVIVFAGKARTIVPLQDITLFYPPKFPIGGGTSLSEGLKHLMQELDTQIVRSAHDRPGDWKPIIFLFTDGVPTDDASGAIEQWRRTWGARSNMVAISIGQEADLRLLQELTPHAYLIGNTNEATYKEFFKWVSATIRTSSERVDQGKTEFEPGKLPVDGISKIDITKTAPAKHKADSNYAVVAAKCSQKNKAYLIKYGRVTSQTEVEGLGMMDTMHYRLIAPYPVDESYFTLSSSNAAQQHISTQELEGYPTCPCCGNQYGFAVCTCGNVHCMGQENSVVCPWCKNEGTYGLGANDIKLLRSQG
jgi:uncharacterized protein YegL